jgi:hypothetical protein
MTVPTQIGSYDKNKMIPSSGSAEILGPEYESRADQQDDASQAAP